MKELILGSIFTLFGMMFIATIGNGVGKLLTNFKLPELVIVLIHIFIIIGGIYLLRIQIAKIITNKELLNSILTLAGPSFAAASFYFSPYVKNIANSILKNTQ